MGHAKAWGKAECSTPGCKRPPRGDFPTCCRLCADGSHSSDCNRAQPNAAASEWDPSTANAQMPNDDASPEEAPRLISRLSSRNSILASKNEDPDNPQNDCLCAQPYGQVPWETYISVLAKPETDEEKASYPATLRFRRADAKAMNQVFVSEAEYPAELWEERLQAARDEARQR